MTHLHRALDEALAAGWRPDDLEALLQGPMRYGNGFPVPCCTDCRKPEFVDGLIPMEAYDMDGDVVVSGERCPQCVSRMRR